MRIWSFSLPKLTKKYRFSVAIVIKIISLLVYIQTTPTNITWTFIVKKAHNSNLQLSHNQLEDKIFNVYQFQCKTNHINSNNRMCSTTNDYVYYHSPMCSHYILHQHAIWTFTLTIHGMVWAIMMRNVAERATIHFSFRNLGQTSETRSSRCQYIDRPMYAMCIDVRHRVSVLNVLNQLWFVDMPFKICEQTDKTVCMFIKWGETHALIQ